MVGVFAVFKMAIRCILNLLGLGKAAPNAKNLNG